MDTHTIELQAWEIAAIVRALRNERDRGDTAVQKLLATPGADSREARRALDDVRADRDEAQSLWLRFTRIGTGDE